MFSASPSPSRRSKLDTLFDAALAAKATEIIRENTPTTTVQHVEQWVSGGSVTTFKKSLAAVSSGPSEICGKVFKSGDLAYNCRQCQSDPTCVMCEACFRDSDHKGHDVSYHRAGPGGTCDCGDSEAFKTCCTKHGHNALRLSEGIDAADALEHVVRQKLFNAFHSGVQFVRNTVLKMREYHSDCMVQTFSPGEELILVVHNDDIHTYDQVEGVFHKHGGMRRPEAAEYTARVDKDGDVDVKKGNWKSLEAFTKGLQQLKLCYSIQTQAVRNSQIKTEALLDWFAHMAEINDSVAKVIADAFTYAPPDSDDASSTSDVLDTLLGNMFYASKKMRVRLQELLTLLLKFSDFRFALGIAYGNSHAEFSDVFGRGIGAEGDALFPIAVQLFTVPSVVTELFRRGTIKSILNGLWKTLSFAALAAKSDEHTPVVHTSADGRRLTCPPRLDCDATLLMHARHAHVIQEISYILRNAGAASSIVLDAEDGGLLHKYTSVLSLCQGSNPQTRYAVRHIELESPAWLHMFNLELHLSVVNAELLAGFADDVAQGCLNGTHNVGNAMVSALRRLWTDCVLWTLQTLHKEQTNSPNTKGTKGYLRTLSAGGKPLSPEIEAPARKRMNAPVDGAVIGRGVHVTSLGTLGKFPILSNVCSGAEPISLHHPLSRFIALFHARSLSSIAFTTEVAPGVSECDIKTALAAQTGVNESFWRLAQCAVEGSTIKYAASLDVVALAEHAITDDALSRPESEAVIRALSPTAADLLRMTAHNELHISPTFLGLALLEQPLRAIITTLQTKARLWVRNGESFGMQVQNYTSPPQSIHFLDPDVRAVQVATLLLSPHQLLAALFTRTGLHDWLFPDVEFVTAESADTGVCKTANFHTWDKAAQAKLLPDLLRFLSIVTTELPLDPNGAVAVSATPIAAVEPNISAAFYTKGVAVTNSEEEDVRPFGASKESTGATSTTAAPVELSFKLFDNQEYMHYAVRREVIHILASGPKPRSAILKAAKLALIMYGKLDDDVTAKCLEEVATYRPPTGMENGVYVLQDAYFNEYDQYFYHLDHEKHVAAFEQWCSKRKPKTSNVSIVYHVENAKPIAPVPPRTAPSFLPVRSLLHSVGMVHLLRRVFAEAVAASADDGMVGDAALSGALHLLTLALHTLPQQSKGTASPEEPTVSSVFINALLTQQFLLPFGAPPKSDEAAETTATPSDSTPASAKRKRDKLAHARTWSEEDEYLRESLLPSPGPNVPDMLFGVYKRTDLPMHLREGAMWCLCAIRGLNAEAAAAFDRLVGTELDAAAASERAAAEAAKKAELEARKKAAQQRAMAAMAKQQKSVLAHMSTDDLGEDSSAAGTHAAVDAPLAAALASVESEYNALATSAPLPVGASTEAIPLQPPAIEADPCILCGESSKLGTLVCLGYLEPSKLLNWTSDIAESFRQHNASRYGWLGDAAKEADAADSKFDTTLFEETQRVLSEIQDVVSRDSSGERSTPAYPTKDGRLQKAHIPFSSGCGVTTSFCGHVAHSECMHKYLVSNERRARSGLAVEGQFHLRYEHFEFSCPLCRNLCNMLVPMDAPLQASPAALTSITQLASLLPAVAPAEAARMCLSVAMELFDASKVPFSNSSSARLLMRCGLHVDHYSPFMSALDLSRPNTLATQLRMLLAVVDMDTRLGRTPLWNTVDAFDAEDGDNRRTGLLALASSMHNTSCSLTREWLARRRVQGQVPVLTEPSAVAANGRALPAEMLLATLSSLAYTLRASTLEAADTDASGKDTGSNSIAKHVQQYRSLFHIVTQLSRLLCPIIQPLVGNQNLHSLETALTERIPPAKRKDLSGSFMRKQPGVVFGTDDNTVVHVSVLRQWLAAALSCVSADVTLPAPALSSPSPKVTSQPRPSAAVPEISVGVRHHNDGDGDDSSSDSGGVPIEDGFDEFLDGGDDDGDTEDDYEEEDDIPGTALDLGGVSFDAIFRGNDDDDGDEAAAAAAADNNAAADVTAANTTTNNNNNNAGGMDANAMLRAMLEAAFNGALLPEAADNLLQGLRGRRSNAAASSAVAADVTAEHVVKVEQLLCFRNTSYKPLIHHPVNRMLALLISEGKVDLPTGASGTVFEQMFAFLITGSTTVADAMDVFAVDGDVQRALLYVRAAKKLRLMDVNPLQFTLLGCSTALSDDYVAQFCMLGYLLGLAQSSRASNAPSANSQLTSLVLCLDRVMQCTIKEGTLNSVCFSLLADALNASVDRSTCSPEIHDILAFLDVCGADVSACRSLHASVHTPSTRSLPSLVTLPDSYDALYARLAEAKCQTCDTRPEEAAICLACGTLLCAGSVCCKGSLARPGECTRHAVSCGGGTGIFLLAGSTQTLLIRREYAAYYPSVYVDAHDEQDVGLKRGKPLHLSAARYGLLQEMWRKHQVGREVSRLRQNSDRVIRASYY